MTSPLASGIVPAQLGFLAIYNPSLGTTDETIHDQIVYYASATTQKRRRRRVSKDGHPTDTLLNEERNERLRQIGLAQAMVEFAKGFSGGAPVDSIDTERSRVVLHELEPGWWILASIDLTRLPLPSSKTTTTSTTSPPSSTAPPPPPKGKAPSASPSFAPDQGQFEYSSREVKPAVLLLQDLLRAHSLFLLHHAGSLSSLFASIPRPEFVALLTRYWGLFLSTWNVLLHGNPACNVFGGIKIAACGELGIGVGEEERGSGEREVLEGLAGRVEGLVDLVVGRFGEQGVVVGGEKQRGKGKGVAGGEGEEWLGVGNEVGAEDGAVFLGIDALSRHSLRAVTSWMEDIFTWGENAYGITGSPGIVGLRSKRRRAAGKRAASAQVPSAKSDKQGRVKAQPEQTKSSAVAAQSLGQSSQGLGGAEEAASEPSGSGVGMDRLFGYLKLGYGTSWSLGTSSPSVQSDTDREEAVTKAAENTDHEKLSWEGHFLVGLGEESSEADQNPLQGEGDIVRTRTIVVELHPQASRQPAVTIAHVPPDNQGEKPTNAEATTEDFTRKPRKKVERLRPIVYVNRPFIYILLFEEGKPSPTAWAQLSQSLATQLAALQIPLLTSTAYRPEKPNPGSTTTTVTAEIYDLVFDPSSLTLHSTIPNIPEPPLPPAAHPGSSTLPPPQSQQQQQQQQQAAWTRVEALNTHAQLLSMFSGTRSDVTAMERTCKTGRGWWIVWSRVLEQQQPRELPQNRGSGSEESVGGSETREGDEDGKGNGGVGTVGKEIFLVRRASDHGGGGSSTRGVSASYVGGGMGMGMGLGIGTAGGWADGASRLAQGIGVDTRRYIEGLLSLNR